MKFAGKKILLVEDDISLGENLKERLSADGLNVIWARRLSEARTALAQNSDFSLALLDVGLPDGSGFDLAESIRNCPIIFLTAQGDAESRLRGYELGAEEYIPKPFHLRELLIRIDHVLREHAKAIVYDTGTCDVRVQEMLIYNRKNSQSKSLSATEMKLLEILLRRQPQVVPRDDLMNEVWGVDKDLSHRTIDNMVVKLRDALGDDGNFLKTVRGIGYQFIKGEVA